MHYITYNRFKQQAICSVELNIPYGTELESRGPVLLYEDKPVCYINSYAGHQHFARNDDGQGLRRGALTYAIAYAKRGGSHRFTDEESELICTKYQHFTKPDLSMIVFNNQFFDASIEELEQMAQDLHIKVKEG